MNSNQYTDEQIAAVRKVLAAGYALAFEAKGKAAKAKAERVIEEANSNLFRLVPDAADQAAIGKIIMGR
jgi:hypothetical protein